MPNGIGNGKSKRAAMKRSHNPMPMRRKMDEDEWRKLHAERHYNKRQRMGVSDPRRYL